MNPRFHLPEARQPGQILSVSGQEFHHLRNVLRLASGDSVSVFDGVGRGFLGRILGITRREARIRLEAVEEPPPESPLAITLLVGVPKGEKLELVIQKATELGVMAIQPVSTHRSAVRSVSGREEGRLARWRRVALEACKQSGRSRIPILEPPRSLKAALSGSPSGIRIVLDPLGDPLERPLVEQARESGSSVLAIGPEGGWSPEEIGTFQDAGFVPICLGPRTLRSETAAIASTALLQFLAGDLGFGIRRTK
ncbi:MAG TPA: 16S rRNA (uracil(1498)-N(3))-methyltransferase [Candidatus Polarisedimenticolia bacterium]|nr:16S rRNA (uracil(1498)-N(3))-methyltransferase [Candidatus Polarisedimenticolia bacterium]